MEYFYKYKVTGLFGFALSFLFKSLCNIKDNLVKKASELQEIFKMF